MPLVCLTSPKGGVGKTTLTAHLAYALRQQGLLVTVIDFDSQNALRLHFGLPLGDGRGFVAHCAQADWRQLAQLSAEGIGVLPYGQTDEPQRQRFETRLRDDPTLLSRSLGALLQVPRMVVLADTPPGHSPALKALDRIADLRVVVLMPDAACAALLPTLEQGQFLSLHQPLTYVINQVDRRRQLNLDTTELFQSRLGAAVIGLVHRDETLAEALAMQAPVFGVDPAAASAHDIEQLARQLHQRLQALRHSAFASA